MNTCHNPSSLNIHNKSAITNVIDKSRVSTNNISVNNKHWYNTNICRTTNWYSLDKIQLKK